MMRLPRLRSSNPPRPHQRRLMPHPCRRRPAPQLSHLRLPHPRLPSPPPPRPPRPPPPEPPRPPPTPPPPPHLPRPPRLPHGKPPRPPMPPPRPSNLPCRLQQPSSSVSNGTGRCSPSSELCLVPAAAGTRAGGVR